MGGRVSLEGRGVASQEWRRSPRLEPGVQTVGAARRRVWNLWSIRIFSVAGNCLCEMVST